MARNEVLFEAIGKGNRKAVQEIVQRAVDEGANIVELLNDTMIPAMRHVGDRFARNEIYVPEMLIAARAMQAGLNIAGPQLQKAGHKAKAKVAIGTVKGDMHDIGKNLVTMMLEGAGFTVYDLGPDVHPSRFVTAVQEHQPDVVALSALLTTTMPSMKTTIDALTAAGLRERVKIMVGGAPVTAEYARQIGADGYSPDASRAVRLARTLMAA